MFRMDMQLPQRQVRWEATQTAKDADPVTWWKMWGLSSCPDFLTVAMRVLAQFASSAERVWSSYGHVHTDARNRMSKERAKKLVKIYFG